MKQRRIGKLLLFVLLIAAGLTVGVRGMVRGWELQRRLACAEQMKRIGEALRAYQSEMTGAAPLEWLVDRGILPAEDLKCPAAANRNYVVVTPPADEAREGRALLYEPAENHLEGGNILFADGHVSFVQGEEHQRLTGK